tara:strand:- start:249 stop:1658 length:1410 start_codon:yes stop_codon:yes gene_type:complete
MKTKLLFLLLFVNLINAQTRYLEVKIKDKESNDDIKSATIIEDSINSSLFTFLEEEKVTYGFKYNHHRLLESKITSEGLKRKYKSIIGSIVNNNKVRLLETNNKNTKYASILFDFDTEISEETEYNFKLNPYDYYLQTYSHEDKCYMFTYNSQTNKLCKWTFLLDGSYKKDFYDLKDNYSWVNNNSKNHFKEEFQKVNNKLPNNLIVTSKEYKMYELKDGFIWTLDDNIDYTLIIEFKAPEFDPTFTKIFQTKQELNPKTSNSYLFDDKIAQITSNNSYLNFEIKDFKSKNVIKSFSITKDETIDFKNGPILQEGSVYSFGNTRELEKTSKFLRKISKENNGVSVYPQNGNYRVTIGGIVELSGGGGMMMPGFGAFPMYQVGGFTMSFNPAGFAFGSYSSTGSTRIECLFDSEFNHLDGEIKDNVFDKITKYKDRMSNLKADNVYFLNNKVLFGFYKPYYKSYELVLFE